MPAGNSEIMTLDLSVGMSTAVTRKGFMKYFFCSPPDPVKVLRGYLLGSDLNLRISKSLIMGFNDLWIRTFNDKHVWNSNFYIP